jgi:hypothetical protein
MALTLVDVGADLILNTFFNNTAQQNLKLELFVTDVTPDDADVIGDYTLAVGGGYAAKTLTNNSWTVDTANDPSDAVYAEQTFTFTGPLTTNTDIYGYLVTNNAGTVLIWAEKFASTFTPANNGDQLKVTPTFQLSKGTPS